MQRTKRRFIKRINNACRIISGMVIIGSVLLAMLKLAEVVSDVVFTVCLVPMILCWIVINCIGYFAQRRLINKLKAWAQYVVDTNYYQGQRITVSCRNGVWFSGPEDIWFRKKFIARCGEMCSDTGMRIYYNYSWIMM